MPSDEERGATGPGVVGEEASSASPAPGEQPVPRRRIRRAFAGTRELWRIVYRDPEHVSERLTLYTAERMGDQSREWAESVQSDRAGTHTAQIADELRTQTAHVARIDGAIAGTPFFAFVEPSACTSGS